MLLIYKFLQHGLLWNGIKEATKTDYRLHCRVHQCRMNYSKKFCKFVPLFIKFTWRHVNNYMIRGCVYPFFLWYVQNTLYMTNAFFSTIASRHAAFHRKL